MKLLLRYLDDVGKQTGHPELSEVPIVMITSRTGSKHRNRALEIGVNGYLGKPYNEAQLLSRINEL